MENYQSNFGSRNININYIYNEEIDSIHIMNNKNIKKPQTTKHGNNVFSVNLIDDIPLEEFATTGNKSIKMTDFPHLESEGNIKNFGNYCEYDVVMKATNENFENNYPSLNINTEKTFLSESIHENNNPDSTADKITKSEINVLLEDINQYIKFDEDNIKKSFSVIQDDYLSTQELKIDFSIKTKFNNFLQNFDYKQDLSELKKQIERANFNPQDIKSLKVGPVSSLDYLVEMSYNSDIKRKKSIIENLISLEDIIFRWRKIGGDGNCFYRAVIFGYLENIILERNIPLLEYFIMDIHKKFNEEIYLIRKMAPHEIKKDLVIKILVLIYYSLSHHIEESNNSKDIEKTHDLFIRCLNSCRTFDLGLVFYFRFKLYEFINKNENKLYTKDFSVKIGNLLPGEFETDEGNFLYNKFYEDFLMKLYKDAEKIVIYLTPFVLNINLQILIYDFGKSHLEKLKDFPHLINPQEKSTITLLYKGTHYDLIYRQTYFEKYVKYLTQYVNLMEDLKVIDGNLLEEAKKIKSQIMNKENKILSERVQEKGRVLNEDEKPEKIPETFYKNTENENLIDFNSMILNSSGKNLISSSCILNNKISNEHTKSYTDINMLTIADDKNFPIEFLEKDRYYSNTQTVKQSLLNNVLKLEEVDISISNIQRMSTCPESTEDLEKSILSKSMRIEYPSLDDQKLFQHTQIIESTKNKENIELIQNNLNLNPISSDTHSININEPVLKNINLISTPVTFTCIQCKRLYVPTQTRLNLCKECLTYELKIKTLMKYQCFLQTSKANFQEKKDQLQILNLFKTIFYVSNLKIIDYEFISTNEAYKLINTDFKTFLIQEIKSTFCAECEKQIDTFDSCFSFFTLPCDCILCSADCVKKFFKVLFSIEPKKRTDDFICVCSNIYSPNDLKQLFFFCRSNNLKTYKIKVLEILELRIFNQCMMCVQGRNEKGNFSCDSKQIVKKEFNSIPENPNIILCEITDQEIEKSLGYKSFNHIICPDCFKNSYRIDGHHINSDLKYKLNKPVFCLICNTMHVLETCKFIKGDKLKNFNSCKIY